MCYAGRQVGDMLDFHARERRYETRRVITRRADQFRLARIPIRTTFLAPLQKWQIFRIGNSLKIENRHEKTGKNGLRKPRAQRPSFA